MSSRYYHQNPYYFLSFVIMAILDLIIVEIIRKVILVIRGIITNVRIITIGNQC
jgi:hypothetical protein